jgi:hypothetical protein
MEDKNIMIEAPQTGINILNIKQDTCNELKGTYLDRVHACVFIIVNPKDYNRYPKDISDTRIAKEAFNRYRFGEVDSKETLKFFNEIYEHPDEKAISSLNLKPPLKPNQKEGIYRGHLTDRYGIEVVKGDYILLTEDGYKKLDPSYKKFIDTKKVYIVDSIGKDTKIIISAPTGKEDIKIALNQDDCILKYRTR